MKQRGGQFTKFALAFSILIASLSTGYVVAHQCHNQVAAAQGVSVHDHGVGGGTLSSSIMDEVCVGFIFVVLLAGRKFLLKRSSFSSNKYVVRYVGQVFRDIKSFTFSIPLSRSQLGIIRI